MSKTIWIINVLAGIDYLANIFIIIAAIMGMASYGNYVNYVKNHFDGHMKGFHKEAMNKALIVIVICALLIVFIPTKNEMREMAGLEVVEVEE